jgi:hypothetical protein
MKKTFTFLTLALLFLGANAFGQDVILSDQDFINTQILAEWETDTTVSDFVLEPGKTYFVEGQFRPSHPINLKAADGSGDMPVVRTWPNDQGEMPDQTFRPRADFSADGILFNALPSDTSTRAAIRFFRFQATGGVLTLKNCKVINCAQSAIRADASIAKIDLQNSTFANMGWIRQNGAGNGRIIDGRAKAVDTIVMYNCIGVNVIDRILRHNNSTAPFGYVDFQHNTFIHCGSFFGMWELGTLSSHATFKHNLIINPQSFGLDTTSVPGAPSLNARLGEREHLEIYPGSDSIYKMLWTSAMPPIGDTVTFDISNNVYLNTQDIEDMFVDLNIENKEGMTPKDWLPDSIAMKLADPAASFLRKTPDAIEFTNIPNGMTNLVYAWVDRGKIDSQGYDPDSTMDRRDQAYWMNEFDPSWTTSDPDFMATDGKLIGAEGLGEIVSNSVQSNMVAGVDLQVYPNPMNDNATIRFSLEEYADVSVRLYDLIGKEVRSFEVGGVSAGVNEVSLEKGDLNPGLYMLVLDVDGTTEVTRIAIK